jgi:hypothetical protein
MKFVKMKFVKMKFVQREYVQIDFVRMDFFPYVICPNFHRMPERCRNLIPVSKGNRGVISNSRRAAAAAAANEPTHLESVSVIREEMT